RRRKGLPFSLVELDRFLHDLAKLLEHDSFVIAVAPAQDQPRCTSDVAFVLRGPLNDLRVSRASLHLLAPQGPLRQRGPGNAWHRRLVCRRSLRVSRRADGHNSCGSPYRLDSRNQLARVLRLALGSWVASRCARIGPDPGSHDGAPEKTI